MWFPIIVVAARGYGRIFCMRTTTAIAATQSRFITPAVNSNSINAQQQPRQKIPCVAPCETRRECQARLGRHVEKSLRLSIRLLDAEFAKIGLGEALARIGIGVFAWTR